MYLPFHLSFRNEWLHMIKPTLYLYLKYLILLYQIILSISVAGKMKGLKPDSGTRSSLLWDNIRLLSKAKDNNKLPKYIMFENVKNLVSIHQPDFLKHLLNEYPYQMVLEMYIFHCQCLFVLKLQIPVLLHYKN